MNLIIDIDKFNSNYVYFIESVKNIIINNSDFIRIIYSNEMFMLNGIFLRINLKIDNSYVYFNKCKYSFSYNDNKDEIEKIILIEQNILHMININNKVPVFRLGEQVINENIKLFYDSPQKNSEIKLILKISGIWESDTEYGMIYKFINI